MYYQDDVDIVEPEIVENSIDQNTIPHFSFDSSLPSTTAVIPTYKTTTKRILSTTKPNSNITVQLGSTTSKIIQSTSTYRPDSTSIKYVPITTVLNSESKTESSNEQQIVDKFPQTTTNKYVITKLPATTQESIKLQTFQSVQEETTFPTTLRATTERVTIKLTIPTKTSSIKPIVSPTITVETSKPKNITTKIPNVELGKTTTTTEISISKQSTTQKSTSSAIPTKYTPSGQPSKKPHFTPTTKRNIPKVTTTSQLPIISTEPTLVSTQYLYISKINATQHPSGTKFSQNNIELFSNYSVRSYLYPMNCV